MSPPVPYTSVHALVRPSSTLLCSSILLRFLLLALLGTANATFYYWDYYTISYKMLENTSIVSYDVIYVVHEKLRVPALEISNPKVYRDSFPQVPSCGCLMTTACGAILCYGGRRPYNTIWRWSTKICPLPKALGKSWQIKLEARGEKQLLKWPVCEFRTGPFAKPLIAFLFY